MYMENIYQSHPDKLTLFLQATFIMIPSLMCKGVTCNELNSYALI